MAKIPWNAADKDKIVSETESGLQQPVQTGRQKNEKTTPTVYPDIDFVNRTEP